MSFNKIILVGNLGKDPELRYTPQGKAVCSFTIAVNERRKNAEDVTMWFKVTCWGQMAETASAHLERGQGVYIEGRLRIEEWTDRDNNKRYTLDVQATDMQFLPRSDAGNAAQSGGLHPVVQAAVQAGDDIPF